MQLRTADGHVPRRIVFYRSPVMQCADEQFLALFQTVCALRLRCGDDEVECVYATDDDGEYDLCARHAETLYVFTMALSELQRMRRRWRHHWPHLYVWWQVEQYTNSMYFSNRSFLYVLDKAAWIWDYAETNIEHVQRLVSTPITWVPHAFDARTMLHEPIPPSADPSTCEVDVLFMGTVSGWARQAAVLTLRDAGLRVELSPVDRYWYGAEREQHIRSARVHINVHYFRDPAVQETCRLNILLSNGACVVSERSGDAAVDAAYGDAIVLVDQGDFAAMARECRRFVDDVTSWCEQRQRALAYAARDDLQMERRAAHMCEQLQLAFQ